MCIYKANGVINMLMLYKYAGELSHSGCEMSSVCNHFFSAGARLQTGTGGEGPKTVWTAHQQQCFPAVLHPNPRVSERLLHARPRQRRLLDHDRFAK